MSSVYIEVQDTSDLVRELRKVSLMLKRDIGIAIWKAGKWSKSQKNPKSLVKQAAKVINLPATAKGPLGKVMRLKKIDDYTAAITVRSSANSGKNKGILLSNFNPRQLKRGGVTAKAYNTGGGRTKFPNAFILPKTGGRGVYERVGKGRLPLRSVRYPTTPETLVKSTFTLETERMLRDRVKVEIANRIDYNTKRIMGTLRGKQPGKV